MRDKSISEEPAEQPLFKLHLLYHELRPGGSEYSYVLATNEFEKHVKLFVQLQTAERRRLIPEVTFDDGHSSNFEYALPILQSHDLIARFFITAGWTGKKPGFMGWEELRSLHASGQQIGAHGMSHTLLTHCAPADLDIELNGARQLLEDKLGTSITTISLPGGRYNRKVLAACWKAGYTEIYTSVPKAERQPQGPMIGRLNIRGDMSLDVIRNVLDPDSSALSNIGRQHRIKAAAKTLMGDRLYEKLWALLNRKESDSGDDEGRAE